MRKVRATVAATAIALAAAMTPLASTPALAAKGHCPEGAACVWRDTSAETAGKGTAYVSFQRYIPNYGQWKYRGTSISANNSATSFFNNGQSVAPYSDVYFFKGTNGNGAMWRVSKGSYYWNLAVQSFSWNDTISSGYFYNWSPRKY